MSIVLQPFDEFLDLIRLRVSIYHNALVCGDWQLRDVLGPDATCFHMVTIGQCRLQIPGQAERILQQGDLVLLPREMPHTLVPLTPLGAAMQRLPYRSAVPDATGMLCGRILFRHRGSEQLLTDLPAVIVLQMTGDALPWLQSLQALIVQESLLQESGTSLLLERLCEILVIYSLREHLRQHGPRQGIMALYSHARLAPAMQLLHQRPAHDWSLQQLADACALSRSAFANVFKKDSGWSVMQYLTWWRMQLAWRLLESGQAVAQAAASVGYKSEAAFSRAFSREFGLSPGAVRRQGQVAENRSAE